MHPDTLADSQGRQQIEWIRAAAAAIAQPPLRMRGRTHVAATLDFTATQALTEQNCFRGRAQDSDAPPTFAAAKELLPAPFWEGHDTAIACWWWTWEKAFANLCRPPSRAHIANYIDTAFNGCLFLWDSVFILQFARYGARAFPFQRTLDNLYAGQRDDGFITRELRADGTFQFHPHDPSSTGPNVLAWSEWASFQTTGDGDRLACVFPVILAYHRWLRFNRSWQDGSYFSNGFACGMDNLQRQPAGYDEHVHHGHMSWIDATAQAALSADLLLRMGEVLGRTAELAAEREEHHRLCRWVTERAWNPVQGFCGDVDRTGQPTGVKHIGGYWALLAGLLDPQQAAAMAAHLEDPASFNRPHRVPTLAADQPGYSPTGRYWNGAVWAPTTWMVLKGLERAGFDDLAHAIAVNHHEAVVRVWQETGTVWENYMPESDAPGQPAKRDFVGWTGLSPIAVLLEHRFGLRPHVPAATLVWDVRLTEAFGVERYPYGATGLLDLRCAARMSPTERPQITVRSNVALNIDLRWAGGSERIALAANDG
jgi:hypothetical protein